MEEPTQPESPAEIPVTTTPDGLPIWPLWVPFASVILGFALLIPVALAGSFFDALFGLQSLVHEHIRHKLIEAISEHLFFLSILGALLLIGRGLRGGVSTTRLGLTRTTLKRAVALMITAGVIEFLGVQLLDAIAPGVHQDPLIETVKLFDVNTVILAVLVAPVIEEIVYRGVLFAALARRTGVWIAALVSAVLFGASHFANTDIYGVIQISFGGLLLALLYWQTRSIIPGILLHAYNNAVAVSDQIGNLGDWSFLLGLAVVPLAIPLILIAKTRVNPPPLLRRRRRLAG